MSNQNTPKYDPEGPCAIHCKLIQVEQGSEKWKALRRGRITASRMGDVLAGKDTRRYIDYRMQLALELLGHKEDEEQAKWMLHGKQMEPHIREAYAKKFDREVTADVFCISEKYDWLGCSPDGLVLPDHNRAIEIKSREKMSTYEKVLAKQRRLGKIDSNYRAQVAAQCWVLGLPAIDYCEGWADLDRRKVRLHVKTVPIDEKLVELMEFRCLQLMVEVFQLASRVRNNRARRTVRTGAAPKYGNVLYPPIPSRGTYSPPPTYLPKKNEPLRWPLSHDRDRAHA
jgi:putative phage-type endonuclease